jgi:hypothetical protein
MLEVEEVCTPSGSQNNCHACWLKCIRSWGLPSCLLQLLVLGGHVAGRGVAYALQHLLGLVRSGCAERAGRDLIVSLGPGQELHEGWAATEKRGQGARAPQWRGKCTPHMPLVQCMEGNPRRQAHARTLGGVGCLLGFRPHQLERLLQLAAVGHGVIPWIRRCKAGGSVHGE